MGSSKSATIEEARALMVDEFVIYAMMALVSYEYLLTIRQEISMIWRRKHTAVTWLFVSNRYLMLASFIIAVATASPQTCRGTIIVSDFVSVAQYFVFALFSALRIYALWDQSLVISLPVLILNLVPVGVNINNFSTETAVYLRDPVLGPFCIGTISVPNSVFSHLTLATRIAVIVADILVLVLTWVKTFRTYREASKLLINSPLSKLLLRDGTLYFIALLALNVAQVLVENISSGVTITPVTTLIEALTPILISRFLLNLRQAVEPDNQSTMASFSRWSAPGFRVPTMSGIAGNMGEVLEYGAVHDEYITAGASTPLELTTYNTGGDPEYVRDAAAPQGVVHVPAPC